MKMISRFFVAALLFVAALFLTTSFVGASAVNKFPAGPAAGGEVQEVRRGGTVKTFIEKKGFGFIAPDDGNEEIFFDRSNCVDVVQEGDHVTFNVHRNNKGRLVAVQVKLE